MAQETIRLWQITSDQELSEVTSTEIPLEERLEDWLESDISMLDADLLVIGRQVRTDLGAALFHRLLSRSFIRVYVRGHSLFSAF